MFPYPFVSRNRGILWVIKGVIILPNFGVTARGFEETSTPFTAVSPSPYSGLDSSVRGALCTFENREREPGGAKSVAVGAGFFVLLGGCRSLASCLIKVIAGGSSLRLLVEASSSTLVFVGFKARSESQSLLLCLYSVLNLVSNRGLSGLSRNDWIFLSSP